jgi:hypothetical protein
MKALDYFMLFIVVTAAGLAALIGWTLIVKSQLQSSASANPTLAALSALL